MSNGSISSPVSSNIYIEEELRNRIIALRDQVEGDAVTFVGPIYRPFDDLIRYAVEEISP
jgi:hypothetical protein